MAVVLPRNPTTPPHTTDRTPSEWGVVLSGWWCVNPEMRYNAYCVRCRRRVDIWGRAGWSVAKRWMVAGPCPHCGVKVNRLLPAPRRQDTGV